MKLNQYGLGNLPAMTLFILTIGVVGIVGFRVGVNMTQNDQNQQTSAEDSALVNALEAEQQKKDETVKLPAEEEEKEVKEEPTQPVAPTEKKTDDKTYTEEKKDKVYLSITLQSAVQNGKTVSVHSKIEKSVTGTCNFKLYREGYERVHSTKKISGSQDCKGTLDVSNMPNYEGWSLHVWFDGDDGKTYAYQKEQPFALTNPN